MPPPRWELADVFRRFLDSYQAAYVLPLHKRRVVSALLSCRTAALGGHIDRCDSCPYTAISYNSCRNRHCPKCQASTCRDWLEKRESELLDVEYFHVVFTVPAKIEELALYNQRCLYEILFRAASRALLTIAKDPKHLGARVGFLAVLHTWSRTLLHHPHLHCVVPGGGLSLDGTRWVSCRKGFLLPVNPLSSLFRGKFLFELRRAFRKGQLAFPGALTPLSTPPAFEAWLSSLRAKDWVVFSKPSFGRPEQVLRYLGRYTHRVALCNRQILSVGEREVSFRYKDYRDGGRQKVMTLDAHELIRRFLIHVLPDGFHRIRHFGFLSNRSRKQALVLCRRLIAEASDSNRETVASAPPSLTADSLAVVTPPHEDRRCPACHGGRLQRFELAAHAAPASVAPAANPPSRASPISIPA